MMGVCFPELKSWLEKWRFPSGWHLALALFFTALLVAADPSWKRFEGKIEIKEVRPAFRLVDVTVGQGESLSQVLERSGLDGVSTHAVIEVLRGFMDMRKVSAGQKLQLIFDPQDNTVRGIEYPLERTVLWLEARPNGWVGVRRPIPSVRKARRTSGTLSRNLYKDGKVAGMTPAQILDLATIFEHEVDFFSDLRPGDRFSVLSEQIHYVDGRSKAGRILAAALTVAGNPSHAFLYGPKDGEEEYYDIHGRSLQRAFLRAPLNYRRVSSHYTLRRRDPILRTVRPHQAIDYAAAAGTPVVSVGRGRVRFAGWREGYGKLVEVVHPNGYTTRYAHFSRIASGMHKGKQVAQGEVIGYVGQTGHATGPHLHFEILRGGQKINFLSLRTPPRRQLAGEELDRFAAVREERLASLTEEEVQIATTTP